MVMMLMMLILIMMMVMYMTMITVYDDGDCEVVADDMSMHRNKIESGELETFQDENAMNVNNDHH